MAFRLIASDLDGTLRAEGRPFSPRVRKAVHDAIACGVHVVMSTGRMFLTAKPFALDLGLDGLIICDHGATILDLRTDQILFQLQTPVDLAQQVVLVPHEELTLLACIDEEFYVAKETEEARRFVGEYAAEYLHCIPDWKTILRQGPQKLVFIGDPELTSRLYLNLTARFGNQLQIVQSFPRYVELTHRDVSKGKAVAWLGDYWGIQREQVIAIGDQGNDRSMIEWAGMGVAMGNAIDTVKTIADWVTSTAEEDGVAEVIERFILNLDQNEDSGSPRK